MTGDPVDHDSAYAVLLRHGFTTGPLLVRWPSEDVRAAWVRDVAEPWLQAMRERAAADGLRVTWRLSCDGTLWSVGFENVAPFVAITSPDGRHDNPGWTEPAAAFRRAMERDWGETLAAARRRHAYVKHDQR